MAHANLNPLFPVFFCVWAAVGIGSAVFFGRSRNARLKRKVWPPFIVATSVVFVGFVWALTRQTGMLYVLVPAVVAVGLVNLRTVQFCDACGATLRGTNLVARPAFCSKCGASLRRS